MIKDSIVKLRNIALQMHSVNKYFTLEITYFDFILSLDNIVH